MEGRSGVRLLRLRQTSISTSCMSATTFMAELVQVVSQISAKWILSEKAPKSTAGYAPAPRIACQAACMHWSYHFSMYILHTSIAASGAPPELKNDALSPPTCSMNK